jgi:hypothetical protein
LVPADIFPSNSAQNDHCQLALNYHHMFGYSDDCAQMDAPIGMDGFQWSVRFDLISVDAMFQQKVDCVHQS